MRLRCALGFTLAISFVMPATAQIADASHQGWFAGDGSIHTATSALAGPYMVPYLVPELYWDRVFEACPEPLGDWPHCFADRDLPSVTEQAEEAQAMGLSWFAVTEHEDMLAEEDWDAVRAEVEAVSGDLVDVVLLGQELGTSWEVGIEKVLGHCLVYGTEDQLRWDEGSMMLATVESQIDVMERVYEDHVGIAAVAHANHKVPPLDSWLFPWLEAGYEAMEALSPEQPFGWEVIDPRYGSIEERQLADYHDLLTDVDGAHVFPLGNSGAHWPSEVGTAVSYAECDGGVTEDAVLEAMRSLQIVASTGSFATLVASSPDTLEAGLGDVVDAVVGDEVTFTVSWVGAGDGAPTRVRVYGRESTLQQPLVDEAFTGLAGEGDAVLDETAIPERDGFYWARVTFSDGSEVVTAPIWVEVEGNFGSFLALDTALIIDSSGSMGSNDPSDLRLTAAQSYVDLARDGDYVSVVQFDSTASTLAQLTPVSTGRQSLKAAIATVDSSGGTDLGAGLEEGYETLEQGFESHQKIAIFLTDGDGDYINQAADYAAQGWRVYTIGLSSSANDTLLQSIADETGGAYFEVLSLAGAEQALMEVYTDIATVQHGMSEFFSQDYTLSTGQSDAAQVDVGKDIHEVVFMITWTSGEFRLTATSPSGDAFAEGVVDPTLFHALGPSYEFLRITSPEPGTWNLEVDAIYAAGGITVTLTAQGATSTRPMVVIDSPTTSSFLSGREDIQVSAEDLEGIAWISLTVGETTHDLYQQPFELTVDTEAFSDGLLPITAKVHDVDGHIATTSFNYYVLNDTASWPYALVAEEGLEVLVGESATVTAEVSCDDEDAAWTGWFLHDGSFIPGVTFERTYDEVGDYPATFVVWSLNGYGEALDVVVHADHESPGDDDDDPSLDDDDDVAGDDDDGTKDCTCRQGAVSASLPLSAGLAKALLAVLWMAYRRRKELPGRESRWSPAGRSQ